MGSSPLALRSHRCTITATSSRQGVSHPHVIRFPPQALVHIWWALMEGSCRFATMGRGIVSGPGIRPGHPILLLPSRAGSSRPPVNLTQDAQRNPPTRAGSGRKTTRFVRSRNNSRLCWWNSDAPATRKGEKTLGPLELGQFSGPTKPVESTT